MSSYGDKNMENDKDAGIIDNGMRLSNTLDPGLRNCSQSDKAVDFWNNYHHSSCGESKDSKEWIIHHDSTVLMELMYSHLSLTTTGNDNGGSTDNNNNINKFRNILEIGCGSSFLSRSFMEHLLTKRKHDNDKNCGEWIYQVVATDVSHVCVQWSKERDRNFIQKIKPHLLDYQVLDVIDNILLGPKMDGNEIKYNDKNGFDMILDKGCLDTFLFRGGSHSKEKYSYPPLLTKLLHNIHAMLNHNNKQSGEKPGKYIIITPRSKIKAVRDFQGFSNVQRITLTITHSETKDAVKDDMESKQLYVQGADLERGNRNKISGDNDQVYMYVCTINPHYRPNEINSNPYRSAHKSPHLDADSSTCNKCRMTFKEYRSYEDICHRGKNYWTRRWNSHRIHCKG